MLLRERTRLAQGWTFLSLAAQDAVISASETEAAVQPETKYAQLGGDRIAYQVVGQGPPDLVMTTASFGDIDVAWEDPGLALFYRTLASFSQLILLNRRGTGASDPLPPDPLPPWESYAQELAVILDEVGSQRAALLATVDAGPTALFFAATRPERTSALILGHTTAKCVAADDHPIGVPAQVAEAVLAQVDQTSPSTFPGPGSWSFPGPTSRSSGRHRSWFWTRWRSSSPVSAASPSPRGGWPPCCSLTLLAPPSRRRGWATDAGVSCWTSMTSWPPGWSRRPVAGWSRPPAMASWRPSMVPPAGSAARPSSEMSCAAWGSSSGRGCMPARSSCATATLAASPCTSRPGSWRRPQRVRSLPLGPSTTWWSAQISPWRTAGPIHCRAFGGAGSGLRWGTLHRPPPLSGLVRFGAASGASRGQAGWRSVEDEGGGHGRGTGRSDRSPGGRRGGRQPGRRLGPIPARPEQPGPWPGLDGWPDGRPPGGGGPVLSPLRNRTSHPRGDHRPCRGQPRPDRPSGRPWTCVAAR